MHCQHWAVPSRTMLPIMITVSTATSTMPLRWFTWYDFDPKQPGNLATSTNLTLLDETFAATGRQGMWDIGDGMCGQSKFCDDTGNASDPTPCGQVWGEPFCGGAKGVTKNWKTEADKIVKHVVARPHIAGIFLGDEGILLGIDENDFCTLGNYTKAKLREAGRPEVFIYFNDGPTEMSTALYWQHSRPNAQCADYFSMDAYQDSGEPEAYLSYYKAHKKHLRSNQGFFIVPGLFWYMARSAKQMWEFEPNLLMKLRRSYEYALGPELNGSVVGINPWHWKNRKGCAQDWCCRGAVNFTNLTALAANITKNITCGGCMPPAPLLA